MRNSHSGSNFRNIHVRFPCSNILLAVYPGLMWPIIFSFHILPIQVWEALQMDETWNHCFSLNFQCTRYTKFAPQYNRKLLTAAMWVGRWWLSSSQTGMILLGLIIKRFKQIYNQCMEISFSRLRKLLKVSAINNSSSAANVHFLSTCSPRSRVDTEANSLHSR